MTTFTNSCHRFRGTAADATACIHSVVGESKVLQIQPELAKHRRLYELAPSADEAVPVVVANRQLGVHLYLSRMAAASPKDVIDVEATKFDGV